MWCRRRSRKSRRRRRYHRRRLWRRCRKARRYGSTPVRVEGVTVYTPESIAPLYADLVGATVPRTRLDAVIEDLQTRYRTDGYILTVVRGELQSVNGRTVFVLRAIEGYISEVKLDGDIGPAGTLVYEFLEHLTWIRPVNNADLERYLLLVQDIPGVSVRAVLRRATEPGAVELVAQLSRKPFSALAQYDNLGSNEAGPNEMLLRGSTNSFTRFGEQFEAIFFNTFNREELFGQINASAFLGAEGLKLAGYWGRGNSLPGGALAGTGFEGDYTIAGVDLSYPVIRSRRLNFTPDISFDYYNSSIDVNGAERSPGAAELGSPANLSSRRGARFSGCRLRRPSRGEPYCPESEPGPSRSRARAATRRLCRRGSASGPTSRNSRAN